MFTFKYQLFTKLQLTDFSGKTISNFLNNLNFDSTHTELVEHVGKCKHIAAYEALGLRNVKRKIRMI